MTLTRYRLGDLVEKYDKKCNIPDLTVNDISGINRDKEFFEPSKQVGKNTSNYKFVPVGHFATNLMHVGRDVVLPVAYNHSSKNKIVSPAYTVFKVKDNVDLIDQFLFIYFNSNERDRYFWFSTDASIRDGLSWEDFCDIKIDLPPLDIQKKYVDIYKAMLENQTSYEKGLEDLKLSCFAHIEHIRKNSELFPIGNYIEPINEKNSDGAIKLEQGINIEKRFISPQRPNSNLKGRKIVRTGQFAYCTQLNNENVAIALREDEDCVVSSVYDVFKITKEYEIFPNYLMLWLIRPEFGRYVYWASEGSAYEFLSYENLSNYLIPVPPIEVQNSIANIYKVYTERKEINEKLKERLKNICPILIKGAVEEAKRKEA